LDQSTASFLESKSAGHGHGTMVAGIIAALAPDAMIMPLRAFDDNGVGYAFQVGKAIRYAVKNGANVINLSLGLADDSSEVRSAIDFATKNHVIVVASVGNGNSDMPHFPASLPNVIGVAASDLYDHKGTFSNFGSSVSVTAPGVAIITAYPNGYAVASGTSFSSPIVAAEAALLLSLTTGDIDATITGNTVNIDSLNKPYAGKLGHGRVDLLKAVSH
jgi:subtilisin family serine protease